jgi:hypothetical protein
MKNEEIVNAAKEHEKGSEFGKLAKSELSRGVNSAYGIGFLDGAEWALSQPQIIEIFGKRVKIVEDDNGGGCKLCGFKSSCRVIRGFFKDSLMCKSSSGSVNRHFVEVDEDGNEIK